VFRKEGRSHLRGERSDGGFGDFFAAEAAGLRWLGDAGAPVVRVLDVGPAFIELEQAPPGRATVAAARDLGAALARMHSIGVDGEQFGCPPAGFDGQLFIGKRPMSSVRHATWGALYIAERASYGRSYGVALHRAVRRLRHSRVG